LRSLTTTHLGEAHFAAASELCSYLKFCAGGRMGLTMKQFIFKRDGKYPLISVLAYFTIIAVLVAVDQSVKLIVVTKFQNADFPLIGKYIRLTYVENTGMAFSMLQGRMLLLIIATAIMVTICLFLLVTQRLEGKVGNIALALICAGGIGNLIDRVSRGYVIDYIYPRFINFAIFNIADCCVVVGAILLCMYLLLFEKSTGNKAVPK
jgi:signal peptidase II